MNGFSATDIGSLTLVETPMRVSVSNARGLITAVLEQLQGGRRHVALDLRKTETIDSTALGALVQLFRSARSKGAELSLLGPTDSVRRVLALTRLDAVIPVLDESAAQPGGAS